MKFNQRTKYWRPLLYITGLNILALGTVLFACGRLGVSALVSVPQVLSLLLPVTLGQATTSVFVILVVLELILLRKLKWQVIAQLVLAFIFGWIVDFYGLSVGLEKIGLHMLWEQVAVTFLAIVFTSLGIFMMVKANFILIPPDGVVNIISTKVQKQFGKIKLRFDLTMIIISIILSLTFLKHIAAIGIGTILAVLFVGQLINFWEYLFITRKTPINSNSVD